MISTLIATAAPAATNAVAGALAGIALSLAVLISTVLALAVYFTPTIIAFTRKRPNAVPVMVLNFFLGWSLVGWVVSLVWALAADQPIQHVFVNQVLPSQAAGGTE